MRGWTAQARWPQMPSSGAQCGFVIIRQAVCLGFARMGDVMKRLLLLGLICLACASLPMRTLAADPALGQVSFDNTGKPQAQEAFLKGLALLHNFEYDDAAEAFRAAQQTDPGFVMAYWGEAMTYNHAVWMEQDPVKARAVLARLGPTPEARAKKAGSPREAAYLHAVEVLYGPGTKAERDDLYSDAMGAVHRQFPDDVDATAFYALSILGTAHKGRDFAIYMRSAALLEEVFPTHQHHPGVLHYLIHSYDDPVHAPLGLRAARLYGAVAPHAGHALHMTSHIFVALGMWDEVIAANQAAMATEDAKDAAAGRPPTSCWHYNEWLVYGYLQERRLGEAEALADRCRQDALLSLRTKPQTAFPGGATTISWSSMLDAIVADTGRLPKDAEVPIKDGTLHEARFNIAYARALAAGRDRGALEGAAGDLHAAFKALLGRPKTDDADAADQDTHVMALMVEEVDALRLAAAGKSSEAIDALRNAASKESAMPMEFGPPAVPKPVSELLGDMLMEAARPAEAASAYKATLALAPGRTVALRGLMRAQTALGDTSGATATQAQLATYVRGDAARR